MPPTATVVLRRSWPQRLVILCCVGVIAGAGAVSWFLGDVYDSVSQIGRVSISGEILLTETDPGEPVNFLLIGEDSALGLDPDDPVLQGREFDPDLRFQADSITILRVNPETEQAWVLSLPRDLLVDRGGEKKINGVYFVDGPDGLIETITDNFGITINHFMRVDFLGFREVVDEIGGIPVWFENPARDDDVGGGGSGLRIETAGCHVLDGEQALQYVRARHYQELIDDEWTSIGNSDFGRVERQQDFLVLAMDRAIDRGARNPANLAALISAGAESILLDDQLTVAELVEVGNAFSDFNPENLQRFGVEVTTAYDEADNYLGERPIPGANDDVFAIFKGEADLQAPDDVDFSVYGADVERIAEEFRSLGFGVTDSFALDAATEESVVVHPTGRRAEAETVARYLLPIPRLVEDPDATEVSLVLGSAHEQVLVFYPHDVPVMREGVDALGDGPVPVLDGAESVGTVATPTTTLAPTSSLSPTSTTVAGDAPTSSTTTLPGDTLDSDLLATTTTAGVIGRAPEGQSCG